VLVEGDERATSPTHHASQSTWSRWIHSDGFWAIILLTTVRASSIFRIQINAIEMRGKSLQTILVSLIAVESVTVKDAGEI